MNMLRDYLDEIIIYRGSTPRVSLQLFYEDNREIDLTGCTVYGDIRDKDIDNQLGTLVGQWLVEIIDAITGRIQITAFPSPSTVPIAPGAYNQEIAAKRYYTDIRVEFSNGLILYTATGHVTMVDTQTIKRV